MDADTGDRARREEAMVLEKMIDELYWLSRKAIASGIHVSFEIGLAGYPCRVWVEGPAESKMTTYDIYRDEVLMEESVKNYEAAVEHLTRLLKENGS
jgi:hypothetical protein